MVLPYKQERSQNTVDARAQYGHIMFVRTSVQMQKHASSYGESGDMLSKKILELLSSLGQF